MKTKLVVLILSLVVAVGCSDDRGLIKISGTITFDGNEPPAAGSMRFVPEPGQANMQDGSARFDQDGKFAASTWEKGDGLRPGKYRVRIECWEAMPSMYGSAGISLIDRKYLDWGNTAAMPLLEVVAGQPKNDLVFDVSAAAEAAIRAERTVHNRAEANAPTMQMQMP